MSAFLRDTQLAEIRHRKRLHAATARLKKATNGKSLADINVRELRNAARHLIRLLETQ